MQGGKGEPSGESPRLSPKERTHGRRESSPHLGLLAGNPDLVAETGRDGSPRAGETGRCSPNQKMSPEDMHQVCKVTPVILCEVVTGRAV